MSIEQVLKNLDALEAKLDAALTAQPPLPTLPAQEPAFGWIKQSELAHARLYGGSVNLWLEKHDCDFPLYTTPPKRQWVGLTETERNDLEDYCEMIIGKAAFDAIEAKLKERNHGT